MSNDTNLKILITADNQTAEGVRGAQVNIEGLGSAVHEWASDFVSDTVKAAASMFALREIIHATADTIGEIASKADELRDLTTSIGLLSSSFGEGEKSMSFFRKAQDDTRNSGMELAALYRDELPLAVKHFGEQGTRDITVMLAEIAPLVGKTASDMEEGFKQLLAGRVRGTNPILVALGMTKEDFQDRGFDGLLAKLAEGAERGKEMGDTFASAGHKIKEEWFDVLADGFNSSRDAQDSFVSDMKRELLAPDVLQGLREIGSGIAGIEKAFGIATIALDNFDKNLRLAIGDGEKFEKVLGGAILGGALGLLFGPVGAVGGAVLGGGIQAVTNAWADPSLSDSETAAAKSQEQRIRDLINQRTGRNALSSLDIEHIEGGPYNSLAALETSFGAFASSHTPDEVKKALAAVNDEIHNGTLKWTDYTSSIAYVTTHLHDVHDALKDAGPDVKALTAELEEQIKRLQLGLQVDKAGFGAQKEYVALTVTSPFERKQDDAEINHNEKLAELYERQAAAQATIDKLSVAKDDDGAKKRVADAEAELNAISRLRDIENARFETAQKFSVSDFWQKFDQDNANALADSLRKVDEFTEATEGKLAAMAPAAQEAIRSGLAAVRQEVQAEMLATQASVMNLAMMGFMPDDPQMVAMVKGLQLDTDQNAKIKEANTIRIGERLNSDAEKSAAKIVAQFDIAFHGAESLFGDLFLNGGRDFGKAAAQVFSASASDLFSRKLESFLEDRAGVTQGSDGLYYFSGGKQGFKTAQEAAQNSPSGQNFAVGAAAFGDFFNGYQSGASGQQNSVLMSTAQGAIEGAMIGSVIPGIGTMVGAVAGAIIGFVGSELGRLLSSKIEVGGIPRVDAAGYGDVIDPSKLDSAQISEWSRQIQSTFDTIRDELVRGYIAGGMTPPGVDKFDNISAPLTGRMSPDDIQRWIQGTLPAEELGRVKEDFTKIAGNLGMSSAKFADIWNVLDKIDPQKAAQDLTSLFTSLGAIKDFKEFMTGDRSVATLLNTKGSTTWQTESSKIQSAGPYDDVIDLGSQMVELASHMKDFSPEGQIAQLQQLSSMMTQFRDLEKQKIQELYQTVINEHAKYDQAKYGIDVQRYTRADGSVDEYGLSQFYQKRANVDLSEMGNAKNAQQLSQFNDDFIQTIINAANAGIAQDPSKRQDWLTWEQNQLDIGKGAFDKRADALGISIDKINTSVSNELDPSFTKLLGTTNDLNTGVGNTRDGFRNLIPPLNDLRGKVLDAGTAVGQFTTALQRATAAGTGKANSDMAALIQEVQGLRAQVAQITQNTAVTAGNTAETAQNTGETADRVASLASRAATSSYVTRTQLSRI